MKNLVELIYEELSEVVVEVEKEEVEVEKEEVEKDFTVYEKDGISIEEIIGEDIYEDEENIIGYYVTQKDGEVKNYFKIV